MIAMKGHPDIFERKRHATMNRDDQLADFFTYYSKD